MFVKVCGITRVTDALHAVEQGATAIGFVLWPKSPRGVTVARAAEIVRALPSHVMKVGVFVNEPVAGICTAAEQARLTAVQLHGDETPDYVDALEWPVIRAVGVGTLAAVSEAWSPDAALLVDNIDPVRRGGTGAVIDWSQAIDVARTRRVVLAGGLTPGNVASAIRAVRPFGVDVSSGVESAPGIKDPARVAEFISNARAAFEETRAGGTEGRRGQ